MNVQSRTFRVMRKILTLRTLFFYPSNFDVHIFPWLLRSPDEHNVFQKTLPNPGLPSAPQKNHQASNENNIVYSGYTTNLAPLAQSCIREHTRSLVRFAHSPARQTSPLAYIIAQLFELRLFDSLRS